MVDRRRQDIFVSACLADFVPDAKNIDALRRLSVRLGAFYRYWEILVVAQAEAAHDHEPLLSAVPNVRLFKVRNGTPFYRRRVVVASEAIGDVVLLTSVEELPLFDPVNLVETAMARGAIVIGRRDRASAVNPALKALGRSAGFRVDERDMLTAAYPRTLLNQLLAHPDRQLALRFPPSDSGIPVLWISCEDRARRRHSVREFGRRLGLIQRLLVSSAPRVLTLVAYSSLVVVVCAAAFAVYAVVVWLTFEKVQQGWFTTSLVLSLTAAFLGSTTFGLSIGLQKVIEALTDDLSDIVTDERSAVDLFGQVIHELNVEVESEEAEAEEAVPVALPLPGAPRVV